MKTTSNKIIALRLSILLLAGVIVSCRTNDEPPAPIPSEAKINHSVDLNTKKLVHHDSTGTFGGIDISADQQNIFSAPLPDSISFVICKASEGVTYTDPTYYNYIAKVQSLNLVSGAYHFYHTADDPTQQADSFWFRINKAKLPDLPPILDIEQGSFCEGPNCITPNNDTLQAQLLRFLSRLQSHCNCTPILYTDDGFIESYLFDQRFSQYPLWLAEYTLDGANPILPNNSPWKNWLMWQKNSNTVFNTDTTDFDIYVGSMSNLKMNKH